MQTISIQIPASLFFEIYKAHGQQTEQRIMQALTSLPNINATNFQAQSQRPKADTITGRVWEIADKLKSENGFTNRNDVVQRCIAEGINMNTANTQFSHWAKEHQ